MAGMSANKAARLGSIATVICCLVCCAIPGMIALIVLNNSVVDWPVVDATVVSTRVCTQINSNTGEDVNQEPTYHVTYNYITLEGQNITSETEYCTSSDPEKGKIKPVTYNPDDPESLVEKHLVDIGLGLAKSATGIGFACSVIAFVAAIIMCTRPDSPPNGGTPTTTYQTNINTNDNTSVPLSGPAGDIPTPTAVPMQPAQVYTNTSTPTSSGPVTYYK